MIKLFEIIRRFLLLETINMPNIFYLYSKKLHRILYGKNHCSITSIVPATNAESRFKVIPKNVQYCLLYLNVHDPPETFNETVRAPVEVVDSQVKTHILLFTISVI